MRRLARIVLRKRLDFPAVPFGAFPREETEGAVARRRELPVRLCRGRERRLERLETGIEEDSEHSPSLPRPPSLRRNTCEMQSVRMRDIPPTRAAAGSLPPPPSTC